DRDRSVRREERAVLAAGGIECDGFGRRWRCGCPRVTELGEDRCGLWRVNQHRDDPLTVQYDREGAALRERLLADDTAVRVQRGELGLFPATGDEDLDDGGAN